jgi:hypothetical protein
LLRLKDRKGIAIHVGRQGGGAHGESENKKPAGTRLCGLAPLGFRQRHCTLQMDASLGFPVTPQGQSVIYATA